MQSHYKRLTDSQWEIMKEYLPVQRNRITERRKYDLRDIVDAILWYLRTGSQWRNLLSCFFQEQECPGHHELYVVRMGSNGNGSFHLLFETVH